MAILRKFIVMHSCIHGHHPAALPSATNRLLPQPMYPCWTCWPREATPTRADCSDAGSADSRTEDSRGW